MSTAPAAAPPHPLIGRTFAHPAFDYLFIGGLLSLGVTALVAFGPAGSGLIAPEALPYFFLVSNAAHFAASTVRLYTKPGSRETWPFLTMGFPLVALAVLSLCMIFAARIGPHLQSLYLTWSPYHYAAQAYGIAVLYTMRSGCRMRDGDKRLLRWTALLPFFYNFITAPEVGLRWLAPEGWLQLPAMQTLLTGLHYGLLTLAFVLPVYLFVRVRRSGAGPMPLIGLLAVVTNGIWFFVLAPLDAFVYATIFHGIQYLAIVIIFHLKDQMGRADNRRSGLYHVIWFYGASLGLGYALFYCLPLAFVLTGFGRVESALLVVAAINLHHFIVDAFIWRFRPGDGNRKIVRAAQPLQAT